MKKVLYSIILILIIGISSVFSQVPQKISYQGVLTDIEGVALNGNFNLQFSLWNSETAGISLWTEVQPVTVNNGLFDVYLGSVNPISLSFNSQYWLEIQVGNSLPLPRVMLASSAYSFISNNVINNAITSEKIANGTIQGVDLNQMGAILGNVITWNGTNWVPLAPAEETDPVFTNSASFTISSNDISNWTEAYSWGNHASAGYLTSFTETDPLFVSSYANSITGFDIANWNTAFSQGTEAYSWGNHADYGYLTSFTETDPLFVNSYANSITGIDIANWNIAFSQGTEAYSWGNHASAGYLTSFTETDPLFVNSYANSITGIDIANWNIAFSQGTEAYSWGNHANYGYLTSYTESDPLFTNSWANSITGDDITNWNTAFSQGTEAYSWGNHADYGYLTSYTESDPLFTNSYANSITGYDITNWNTAFSQGTEAYSWGNHASAGYLTYYDEYDPLFSSSLANSITGDDIYNWNQALYFGSEAYSWGNHLNAGYLHTYDPYLQSINNLSGAVNIVAGTNVTVQESDNNIIISSTGGGTGITFPYLANPSCNTDAFTIMNSGTGGSIVGLASNNNVGRLGSQTYGVVGVNGSNGNLGGLGNLLFSVVGIHGTTNVVGALGSYSSGVYANNPVGSTVAALATNEEALIATKGGLLAKLAGTIGFSIYDSNKSNSFTELATREINDHFVGLFSENYENTSISRTSVKLAGYDYALSGTTGNKNFSIASLNSGLHLEAFWPGYNGFSCTADLIVGEQNDPETYAMYLKTRKSDALTYKLYCGQISGLSTERLGYLQPTNFISLAGYDYSLYGYYGNKDVRIGEHFHGLQVGAYWPGYEGKSCMADFVIGDQNDPETYAMYLKTRKSEFNSYEVTSGEYSAIYANNVLDGITYEANLCTNEYAAWFQGDVNVNGILSKLGGSFKIDHPQDPENKYLVHSFVESPDMKNIYDGVVILDENGEALVELPDYFESLNKDFRYQLTCIGGFANVYIKEKINNNKFKIAGGTAGLEVSWLVTGIRKDPWAEKNRIKVEVEKADQDKGKYLTPEVYNKTNDKLIKPYKIK